MNRINTTAFKFNMRSFKHKIHYKDVQDFEPSPTPVQNIWNLRTTLQGAYFQI